MIACIDVAYDDSDPAGTRAQAACVVAEAWGSACARAEYLTTVCAVAAYTPGRFFERELPCVLTILEQVREPLDCVVIDGYVTLDAAGTLGMGGHLYEALERRIPVVGVAKNPFDRATGFDRATSSPGGSHAIELLRGDSSRPLYVTALGLGPAAAARQVAAMHGRFRLPTLLKRVDRLCRDGA